MRPDVLLAKILSVKTRDIMPLQDSNMKLCEIKIRLIEVLKYPKRGTKRKVTIT